MIDEAGWVKLWITNHHIFQISIITETHPYANPQTTNKEADQINTEKQSIVDPINQNNLMGFRHNWN